jgi:hypothetical protein
MNSLSSGPEDIFARVSMRQARAGAIDSVEAPSKMYA